MTLLLITILLVFLFFFIKMRKEEKKKKELFLSLNKKRSELISYFSQLDSFKGGLYDLFYFHKGLAEKFPDLINKAPSVCPDKYGVFRTKDIATMSPDDVFLGGIWGLFTHNITMWELYKKIDEEAYDTVLYQYYKLLKAGKFTMLQIINKEISQL